MGNLNAPVTPLCTATRDELIEELKNRDSITSCLVLKGEGANIKTARSNIAVSGTCYIFVIEPNIY